MSNNQGTEDDLLDGMLVDFLDESDEIVSSLNENLLKLDEWVQSLSEGDSTHCDDDLMNEMFRGAHSLKGLSGMLGLDNINALTHKVENIFDAARHDQLTLTGNVVQLVFQSVDKLTCMIESLKESDSAPVDCEQVLSEIDQVLRKANVERAQVSPSEAEKSFEELQQAILSANDNVAESAILEEEAPLPISTERGTAHFADIDDEKEVSAKYLAIFIDESDLALEEIAEALIGEVSEKSTEALMIQCHKIKGSAASLGLNRAAKLAHFMEDLLQELLQTDQQLTADMVEAMLRCTDSLRDYVEGLKTGEIRTESFDVAYGLLLASQVVGDDRVTEKEVFLEVDSSAGELMAAHEPHELSDTRRKEIATLAPPGTSGWIIRVFFDPGQLLPGLKASLVHGRLSDLGPVFFCDPPEKELEDLSELECLTLGIAIETDSEAIHDKAQLDGVVGLEIESLNTGDSPAPSDATAPIAEAKADDAKQAKPVPAKDSSPKQTKSSSAKSANADSNKKPTETLRVDIERLDQLMNLAGQLVINKARFTQIGEGLKSLTASKQAIHSLDNVIGIAGRLSRELEEASGSHKEQLDLDSLRSQTRQICMDLERVGREMERFSQARSMINDLGETVHQLDRVADGIQKTIMDTRMVPIGPLFRRFKRVIRDITHGNGKDIQLVIRGENTELDKRMIDELGDPLIHMVRNCADHGIEPPEAREAAGKPRQGTVTLDAFHCGNSILIEIKDDGKGLDAEKIRNKAIEKGIISLADAEKLSTHQVFQLIWEPGLSTAEKVTEVSGRGMGMDIVRTKIEEISGTVELDSKIDEGTTITIKLPLTLAILPSLLIEIEGDVIAMPVESVSEIVRVNQENLSTVHGLLSARVRGRVISVIKLSELFSWNQPPTHDYQSDDEEQSLVILRANGDELGLVADRLIGEEDIVIKSMAENYRNVVGIAGASILGDGRVSLILDVGSVLEMSAHHESTQQATKEFSQ